MLYLWQSCQNFIGLTQRPINGFVPERLDGGGLLELKSEVVHPDLRVLLRHEVAAIKLTPEHIPRVLVLGGETLLGGRFWNLKHSQYLIDILWGELLLRTLLDLLAISGSHDPIDDLCLLNFLSRIAMNSISRASENRLSPSIREWVRRPST
jgi:hypothetical protein